MSHPRKQRCSFLLALLVLTPVAGQAAMTSTAITIHESLQVVSRHDGSALPLSIGLGSGAFHLPGDKQDVLYTITDRGPNIDLKDSNKLLKWNLSGKKGKIFPVPDFNPTIYKLKVSATGYTVKERITLKNQKGEPLSGLSNPNTEAAWDLDGKPLAWDPAGMDSEALIRLQDGTFWIGEEYGPSIAHVAADGKILERWVPAGVAASLKGAGYPVKEGLPALLRSRPLNRGIEALACSPDEQFLYFALQSPLANPEKKTYTTSRQVRLFKIDRQAGTLVGEYVYMLDTPETYVGDSKKKPRKQSDVKLSEMTAVAVDHLVVLERIAKTTKFYRVDLQGATNILDSRWDKAETTPSLEALSLEALPQNKVVALSKALALNTDSHQGVPSKIEGMAWLGDDQWYVINDNDFGIEGERTQLMQVTIPIQ